MIQCNALQYRRCTDIFIKMDILYEDNHIIIVNKHPGEIVQGDRTGDKPLVDLLKEFIKERDAKPGNVFMGVVHRLDRPVGGAVIFAKTSKALSRLNDMLRKGEIHKTYWALTRGNPPRDNDTLINYITTVESNNKSYISDKPSARAKEAKLRYKVIARGDHYNLLEIELLTGRKHQIRVQLSAIGCPIKGDLKYGDRRSNPDGCISLLARHIHFIHPVSGKQISITAPVPEQAPWQQLAAQVINSSSTENE